MGTCLKQRSLALQLLDALELSQSPLLLKLLAGILCRDRKHIMEEQFQTCFQRIAQRSVKFIELH